MMNAKNRTTSKIVAKTFLRLLMIVLAFSIFLVYTQEKMDVSLYFANQWMLIFPILLFLVVLVLLILVLRNKYAVNELNWLFSLSAAFFCIYLIMLYTRIYPLL